MLKDRVASVSRRPLVDSHPEAALILGWEDIPVTVAGHRPLPVETVRTILSLTLARKACNYRSPAITSKGYPGGAVVRDGEGFDLLILTGLQLIADQTSVGEERYGVGFNSHWVSLPETRTKHVFLFRRLEPPFSLRILFLGPYALRR